MRISNDYRTVNFSDIPSVESIRGNAGSSQGSVQNLQYKLSQALEDAGKHFDQVVTAVRGNNQLGQLQNYTTTIADQNQSQGTANNFRLQDYMGDYNRMQVAFSNAPSKDSWLRDGLLSNLR